MDVKINELGRRIGDSHPRAKFTDHEIEQMRWLRDQGWTCRAIAVKFDAAFGYVAEVCRCAKRAQVVAEVRALEAKRVG